MKISRGLRNNNPLNIRRNKTRWRGLSAEQTDSAFFNFIAPAWGYRAAFITLKNYKKLHGIDTIASWVSRWAPPVENDTVSYVNFVAQKTNLLPNEKIDCNNKNVMCNIVAAMSQMENGVPAKMNDVEEGWRLSLGGN